MSKINYGWRFYKHMLQYSPIPTKATTAAVLSFLGNVITQKVFEKNPQMNYNRAVKFVVYASLITPISHYWYKLLDSLFPKDKSRDSDENKIIDGTVLKKLALDELLYDPFCIVFFFSIIGLLERQNLEQIKSKIVKDYWQTQKMSWKVWPVVQFVNFAVVPDNMRILFINLVGFFWGIFLQVMAGKK